MIKKSVETTIASVKRSSKSPTHEVSGPGITGKKLPAIPNKIKKPETQIKKRSIAIGDDLSM